MKQLKWIKDFLTIAHLMLGVFTIGYILFNWKTLTAGDECEEE